jgi:Zn-dependent metalloprotease
MCTHQNHFDPVHCILPPYITERLQSSKNKATVKRAVTDQWHSSRLRHDREFISALTHEQRAMVMPVTTQKRKATLNMQVYDLRHGTDIPGAQLVWNNGTALKKLDKDAKNVVAAGAATWDFYYKMFGRNSVNNLGLLLRHYIHYYVNYNNAMWDGSEMVYGDGDGITFGSFTADPDIIGHELTHGVTQYESNLAYHNQSGALNESLSDVFGIMVKQRMMNQNVKQSDWLIGENVILGKKYALRSMKAPGTAFVNHPLLGTDPQPATMDKYFKSPDTRKGDWGGVHTNSGITNFAFYVTSFNFGGYAWEKAGKIWYAAMTDKKLKNTAMFADFKQLTIQKAETLFGKGSTEAKATIQGWNAAKV